jgi:hypothetical protein
MIGQNTFGTSGHSDYATAIGSDASVSSSNTIALGRSNGSDTVRVPGLLSLGTVGAAGGDNLCRNASQQIAACASSLRYKTDVSSFFGGLDVVRRLRPIAFNWRDGGMSDVGFGAEEVERIEPLLTTRNDQGEIEGVKYGQVTTVLVNAVNEQDGQIGRLQATVEAQQRRIDALTEFICASNREADICTNRK